MAYDRNRPRPTAYRTAGGFRSRPVCLSTGRGDTKLTPTEAVALGLELLAVAAELEPAAAADTPRLILAQAERLLIQSDLLTACANRKE